MSKAKIINLEPRKCMFAVIGMTGAQVHYVDWVVGVFFSEGKAIDHRFSLEEWLMDQDIPNDTSLTVYCPEPAHFLDSSLQNHWRGYGVEYFVEEVKVLDD